MLASSFLCPSNLSGQMCAYPATPTQLYTGTNSHKVIWNVHKISQHIPRALIWYTAANEHLKHLFPAKLLYKDDVVSVHFNISLHRDTKEGLI